MLRRPKAGDTEEDLLAFQENFLSSGERAAATLAGSKRKDPSSMGNNNGGSRKRSKFKQRPVGIEEKKEIPATADVQDRDVVDKPVTMPTWMTKRGFPSVQSLDWSSVSKNIPPPPPHRKKKSLFAQQFQSHSPEYFGFEFKPTNQIQQTADRDKVEPIFTSSPLISETPPISHAESAQQASIASQAMSGLLDSSSHSSLISGDGLVGSGVTREKAREEIKKIHLENVKLLRKTSESELIAEKQRVEEVLGPELVTFLKSRTRGKLSDEGGEGGGGEGGEGGRGRVDEEEDEQERKRTGVVAPKEWLHMEEIERDKMEWMTDVQPSEIHEGGPVRFDLDGLVVPRSTSLPSHSALYHHGNEPAAAGYTLMELLSLVRSAVNQQRVLSLSTLSKIMTKAWRGGYSEVVSHEVLQALCIAGIPLLLRYSIDDSSTAVISAALSALHSLLVPTWEERVLDEMCYCHRGSCQPYSSPVLQHQTKNGVSTSDEEEEEEKDFEIMGKDTVQGYLKTGLLRRLRYILEVVRPGRAEVQLSLSLLTRIARHSLQAASDVVECPRLMATVFSEFLPLVWNEGEEIAYSQPQPAAMRLVHILVCSSRNLASALLARYNLLEVIVRYTLPRPSELSLPPESAYSLSVIAFQTGQDLLQYGNAPNWISDCYPVLSRHIFTLPSLSLSSLPLHEATHLATMISALEPAISVSPPSLVSSLIPPLLSSLSNWIREASEGGVELVAERLVCIRAVLHVLATYLHYHSSSFSSSSSSSSSEIGAVDILELASSLSSGLLSSISSSPLLSTALTALRRTSPLCNQPPPSSTCPPQCLPFLHHSLPISQTQALHGTDYCPDSLPLLHSHFVYLSSSDFLLGYLRLCFAIGSTHKGVVSNVCHLLRNKRFIEYITVVCNSVPIKYSCTVFGEFQLLHAAIRLFMMAVVVVGGDDIGEELMVYHRLSIHLLCLLPPGLEAIVDDLLSTSVLNTSLFQKDVTKPGSLLEEDLSTLSLHHPPQSLSSSTRHHSTLSSLLTYTLSLLPSISSSLLNSIRNTFYSQLRLGTSSSLFLSFSSSSSLIPSLRCPAYSSPLLPVDWFLFPLVSLYQQSLSRSADLGSEVVAMVRNSLAVLLLLEKLRPSCFCHLPPSTCFTRTLLTFLIGNDLFMEDDIRPYLSALLKSVYCSQRLQESLDFTLSTPGLPSFNDLYQTLLTQFAAVSYGEPIFSCFLLLPLQQRFPVSLRHLVWDQNSHTLRLLSLPLTQLPVSLENFLLPLETDKHMLQLYSGALSQGIIQQRWSPLFYLIAIHHIHHFLFSSKKVRTENAVLHETLLRGFQVMKNMEVRDHVMFYAGPDLERPLGFRITAGAVETEH